MNIIKALMEKVWITKKNDRELYFHTWTDKGESHSHEIDFLLSCKGKIIPIEVKSSETRNHRLWEVRSALERNR